MSQKDMFHSDSNTLKRGCQVDESEIEACPCGAKESFAKCHGAPCDCGSGKPRFKCCKAGDF